MKAAFIRIARPGESFAGFYDTNNPAVADVENSLFTNLTGYLPSGITLMRFERGTYAPPDPPVDIDLIGGHMHYYRYTIGGHWTTWDADDVLARWDRLPRRLPLNGSAGPHWLAVRHGLADGCVHPTGGALGPDENFGVRLVVHATKRGPRNAISISENLVDGTLAAFHADGYSEPLFAALARRFSLVPHQERRRALEYPARPLFLTRAIRPLGNTIQFSPADERCIVGEVQILQDSSGQWPQLSGELFRVRRRSAASD